MSIASYSDLTAAASDWLERADLAGRVPDFVALAEAKFNRRLKCRQMEVRASLTIDLTVAEPQFIALPSDFQTMRSLKVTSVTGKPALAYKNKLQIDQLRAFNANSTGQPRYFSVYASVIELAPTPDTAYTMEMVYRSTVPPLQTNLTNWLMTLAPDLYLYGTLMEAAPYLKDADLAEVWQQKYETTLAEVEQLSSDSTYNAGPISITADGVCP